MKIQTNHGPDGQSEAGRRKLIQKRAYELFLKRDRKPGHELEDWLQAEREIRGGQQQRDQLMA